MSGRRALGAGSMVALLGLVVAAVLGARPTVRGPILRALPAPVARALAQAPVTVASAARPLLELGTHEGVPYPIDPAPVWPPPARPPSFTDTEPATPAARRVLDALAHIRATEREGRYTHVTRVNERAGIYLWDCSAMVGWVLGRARTSSMGASSRGRFVARELAQRIARASTAPRGRALQRIERVADGRAGDMFAWQRPRGFPSRNTGHSGFLLARPEPIPAIPGAYALRIGDATSIAHQDDTRADDADGGYGEGTIVLLTDAEGRATHYGWHGTPSVGFVRTPVVLGRLR